MHHKAILALLLFSLLSFVAGVVKLTDDNVDDQLSHGDWLLLLYVLFFLLFLQYTNINKNHKHIIPYHNPPSFFGKLTTNYSFDGSKHKVEEGEWKALDSHAKEAKSNFLVGKADCAK